VGPADALLPNVIAAAGLAASTSEARRLIRQGGVKLDGEKISDISRKLPLRQSFLLQVGKRRFKRVRLQADT
jgi:tyrosyl-tRNA synthetase